MARYAGGIIDIDLDSESRGYPLWHHHEKINTLKLTFYHDSIMGLFFNLDRNKIIPLFSLNKTPEDIAIDLEYNNFNVHGWLTFEMIEKTIDHYGLENLKEIDYKFYIVFEIMKIIKKDHDNIRFIVGFSR